MSVEREIAAWRLAVERGVPFSFRGAGLSMWPTLRAGDEALFAPLTAPPRPGQVLLYRAGERLVAHRFLGARADGSLRLRGDAMLDEDPPVDPQALLGALVGVRRGGRGRVCPAPAWTAAASSWRPARRVAAALAARLARLGLL